MRVLVTGPGNHIDVGSKRVEITEAAQADALEYFAERAEDHRRYAKRATVDGPAEPVESSTRIEYAVFPEGWPQDSGVLVLRNEFPAPLTIGETTYPTVTHAYWGLAVADEQRRAAVLRAEAPHAARRVAANSALRPNWSHARTAIMTHLLRAKFSQHPDLAATLTATGETRLIYNEGSSAFWGSHGHEGRNWMGLLLELIRSELAVSGTGVSLPWRTWEASSSSRLAAGRRTS
ncbi:ribA/ribD-fused uncharacterized protein [Kibdelosporangium phytohabitans]|nr:NADAR family protein [Kibdelosporangium phytohabitans]MBE1469103.1 ribA/ribD-fused uncharacterized protein [Kibdelosporangium phytohabitans]